MRFRDRTAAGEALAERLKELAPVRPVVLALPRGGVPVALPVARALNAPLDLILVRKLGCPGNSELAAGAVVDGPVHDTVFNADVLQMIGLTEGDFAPAIATKLAEIADRRARWLSGRAPVDVAGATAIVVDDGIATGASMKAALKALRRRGPAAIWLVVPVAPAEALADFDRLADRVICLHAPADFNAVGAHYDSFDQVADDAVTRMLA